MIAGFCFFVLLSLLFITASGLIPFPEEGCPSVMLLKPGSYLLWTLPINIPHDSLKSWLEFACRCVVGSLFFGLVLEDANY